MDENKLRAIEANNQRAACYLAANRTDSLELCEMWPDEYEVSEFKPAPTAAENYFTALAILSENALILSKYGTNTTLADEE